MITPSPQILTIIGNVGAGKSSAMPILVNALQAMPLYADDLFQTTDPFAQLYLADTPRWAFANELWLTHQRANLLRSHLGNADATKQLTIVDSGLFMSWVYTYSHLLVKNITLAEWEFYQSLYDHFASEIWQDAKIVRLKYSHATLLKRIKQRGRDYELEYYTPEYLQQIESGLDALEKKLTMAAVPFLVINEAEIADFEHNSADADQLIAAVKNFL